MQYRNRARQAGFTLVEIAIVLVIIGLLLGGVLKGQEMIENAKIKSIASDMKSVQAAYHAYMDRYHATPGDEAVATMTARGWTGAIGTVGAAGDGRLVIPVASAFQNSAATDQPSVWSALRGSGFLPGNLAATGVAGLPTNGAGGLTGITAGPAYGMPGPLVCVSGLSPKQAAGVDSLIDGQGAANNTGSIRGLANANPPLAPAGGAGAPAAVAYLETSANKWTLCMAI